MSSFIQVNEENFEQMILHSASPVLVEFGAEWCAPCKRMEPELEKLAAGLPDRLRLARLDVDQSADLALRYQVMSVPTLILFTQGEARQRLTGYQSKERVLKKIAAYL